MERGFLSLKDKGGGRGVKEKEGILASSSSGFVLGSGLKLGDDASPKQDEIPISMEGFMVTSDPLQPDTNAKEVNDVGNELGQSPSGNTPEKSLYADIAGAPSRKALNFRNSFTLGGMGFMWLMSLLEILANVFLILHMDFFLGKWVAYPVVANYVRNTWGKYGLVRSMFSLSTGLFSFQFSSLDELDVMLENGSWFIRNNPLILKKWHPDVNLLKEDVSSVPVWVKLPGVLVTAFSEDGLSAIATKLGASLMLDSYTCVGETKNLKKPSQTPKGFPDSQKIGFKPKQVYQPVSKKPTANTSRNKKKNVEPTKEVSTTNPFDVLTSVDNDVELGINGGTSNFASQGANSSGSLFGNVNSSSPSTTHVIEKIGKIEKLIIDRKVILVDDEGKPLER
ncbi:retrotransposon protein, putative, unclassified, partial [Tanacetum coccineum]